MAERADGDTDSEPRAAEAGGPCCPRCDAAMFRRHCKYVCPNHGVIYDCSDPFR